MRTATPTLQAYRKMYETAKSLGSAMLACNAIFVPKGYDHLYLLIQNFPRPATTHNDSADVDYARGLQSHVPGTPTPNLLRILSINTEANYLLPMSMTALSVMVQKSTVNVHIN